MTKDAKQYAEDKRELRRLVTKIYLDVEILLYSLKQSGKIGESIDSNIYYDLQTMWQEDNTLKLISITNGINRVNGNKLQKVGLTGRGIRVKDRMYNELRKRICGRARNTKKKLVELLRTPISKKASVYLLATMKMANSILGSLASVVNAAEALKEFKDMLESYINIREVN